MQWFISLTNHKEHEGGYASNQTMCVHRSLKIGSKGTVTRAFLQKGATVGG
jgi:hypothetical protein